MKDLPSIEKVHGKNHESKQTNPGKVKEKYCEITTGKVPEKGRVLPYC